MSGLGILEKYGSFPHFLSHLPPLCACVLFCVGSFCVCVRVLHIMYMYDRHFVKPVGSKHIVRSSLLVAGKCSAPYLLLSRSMCMIMIVHFPVRYHLYVYAWLRFPSMITDVLIQVRGMIVFIRSREIMHLCTYYHLWLLDYPHISPPKVRPILSARR